MNTLDRRRGSRRIPSANEPLSRLRLRAGREVEVLDISSSGAFVEGHVRLLPGTNVDVHVMTSEGRVFVRSRVVRACVWRVKADAVMYRGALAFGEPIDVRAIGYAIPPPLEAL